MNSDEDTEFSDNEDLANQMPLKVNPSDTSIYSGLPVLKVLTDNDLIGYAKARFRKAEKNEIPWPPLMQLIFQWTKDDNISEHCQAMVELLLNVPIQLCIRFDDKSSTNCLNLNDPDVYIPYRSKHFVRAKDLVDRLLSSGLLTPNDIRPKAKRVLFTNS